MLQITVELSALQRGDSDHGICTDHARRCHSLVMVDGLPTALFVVLAGGVTSSAGSLAMPAQPCLSALKYSNG